MIRRVSKFYSYLFQEEEGITAAYFRTKSETEYRVYFYPIPEYFEKLNANKLVFNVENPSIKSNNKADISLFTTEENWTFGKENILSKSKNSAFLGQKMKGKTIGI